MRSLDDATPQRAVAAAGAWYKVEFDLSLFANIINEIYFAHKRVRSITITIKLENTPFQYDRNDVQFLCSS